MDDTVPFGFLSMVNSTGQAEQLLLNKGEVACMSDFDDEDFNDMDVDSDAGSDMEFECNTWKSENPLSDLIRIFAHKPGKRK